MSFSQTELVNAMRLLSTRLPQFPEQQNQVSRMLRIVTERLSSHLNENLKAFGINENLWFSLMAVFLIDITLYPAALNHVVRQACCTGARQVHQVAQARRQDFAVWADVNRHQ